MSAVLTPEGKPAVRPRLTAPEVPLELPAPEALLELSAPEALLELPAPEALLELTAPAAPALLEEDSSEFPRHTLMWALIGVCCYFAVIAVAMIGAAVFSSPSIR